MIDKMIWDKARLLFEHGKPLNEIAKETGINKSTISKKSKSESWDKFNEKSTLVLSEVDTIVKQNEINQQKSTLNQQELNFHNIEVANKLRRSNLVFGNAEKLASKIDKLSDEVDEPQDIRHLVEANHKIGQSLGVIEQFAPKTVIENTNAQQNNNLTKAEISIAIAESLPD